MHWNVLSCQPIIALEKKIPHFAYTTNKRQTTVANESAATSNNHFFTHPLHNRRTLGYNDKGGMARY